MDELLKLLRENAHESIEDIACMLATTEDDIRARIADYEKRGVIRGYRALIDEDKLKTQIVRAAIEVRITPERNGGFNRIAQRIAKFEEVDSLFLMSGGYDLLCFVTGSSLQDVAGFVSEKLATINGVISTGTHFMLKTFKDRGFLFEQEEEKHERLSVSP